MAFDGIVTKKVVYELQSLVGYKIDKIYEPNNNTVILGLYGNFANVALLACISPSNYRVHLTKTIIKNPTIAPNFCMLLRKHILGYKIKRIYTKGLERIIYIELENTENPNKIIVKKIIIELMGKHSNIILLDYNNIIIDSIRHTNTERNAQRDIFPTSKYIEPTINKKDFLEIKNFDNFYNTLNLKDEDDYSKKIVETFNGISISNLAVLTNNTKETAYTSNKRELHNIYNSLNNILNSKNITIKNLQNDYCLCTSDTTIENFKLNYALDSFYYTKETNELFKNYRNTLLNIILSSLKKFEKRLENIDAKLEECKTMDKFKLYGELLTANLYKIPNYNISSIELENYYDNNNPIVIPLDKKYSPQYNANRFYKKYTKLKNALEIVNIQKQETIEEINYIESIIYELDNCKNIDDIQEIYDEISENDIFKIKKINKNKKKLKPKKTTSNKFASFNPLKYIIDSYTIYVGKNNKENDYLTNKFANKNDLWLHTKDIHGSHVIIKSKPKEIVPENVIFEAAKLAAMHSKAKGSSNVPVDYCLVQFVKKVPGNKPGLVIYKNNKTIYV